MKISNVYNLLVGVLSAVLAVMYLAVLMKVQKGSKFLFVIVITALMLVSNLAAIVVVYLNSKIIPAWDVNKTSYPTIIFVMVVFQGVMDIIRDSSFNLAHWEFAFKYFKISY